MCVLPTKWSVQVGVVQQQQIGTRFTWCTNILHLFNGNEVYG